MNILLFIKEKTKKFTASKRVLSRFEDSAVPKPKTGHKYDIKDNDNFTFIRDTKLKFYNQEKDIGTFVVKKKTINDEYVGKHIDDMEMSLSLDLDSDDDVDVKTCTVFIHEHVKKK